MAFRRPAISLVLVSTVVAAQGVVSDSCSGEACPSETSALLQLKSRAASIKMKRMPGSLRWWGQMMGGCRSKFKNTVKVDPSTLNGPTLNAADIPKYVTPLVIPPVMRKAGCHKSGCGDYEVAVREFQQQILPGGQWNSAAFKDYNGGKTFNFPATTVWGFGPADDPQPNSRSLGGGVGIAPAANSQFNYPSYTIETITNVPVKVDWINHLVKNPWRCNFKNPPKCWGAYRIKNYWACKACEFTPHITPVDQSLHWANPGKLPCTGGKKTDCMPVDTPELKQPYTGPVPMSIHLHGAHVQPESDGYPEAWYLPAASNIPRGFAQEGSLVNQYGPGRKTNHRQGVASFNYGNNQPTTTLWFHDHTLGITRNNVYAGPAGFWLIRKANGGEDGLVSGVLPHPAPKPGQTLQETNFPPGRNKFREIPVVIQDRSFNLDGSLFYPADRAFFEGLAPEQLKIPLLGDAVKNTDVPPIWNPEAFFDAIVVNGVTWPLMEVEPDIYRFRLLNGCNCRTLNLVMFTVDAQGNRLAEVPFYVIGGDQSLLPQVVMVTENFATALPGNGTIPSPTPSQVGEGLLMGPAYRTDVLIDFTGFAEGTLVQIFNTGEDSAPFAGFPIQQTANPETVGQIMRFRVVKDTPIGEDATPPQDLVLTLVDAEDPAANLTPTPGPQLSLMEFPSVDVCVFPPEANGDVVWDPLAAPAGEQANCTNKITGTEALSQPFAPLVTLLGKVNSVTAANGVDATGEHWFSPISLNPRLNATETWEFWDLTADAHPIHVHLVRFRVLGRREFNATNGDLGPWISPNPTDAGWRDTIMVYPGAVTYVKARFSIPGLYVWHCHMLEHEDQEMMLPYCVGDMATAPGCARAQQLSS